MTWLIAFLVSHAIEIAAIGGAAAAIASVESVAINTITLVREAEKD